MRSISCWHRTPSGLLTYWQCFLMRLLCWLEMMCNVPSILKSRCDGSRTTGSPCLECLAGADLVALGGPQCCQQADLEAVQSLFVTVRAADQAGVGLDVGWLERHLQTSPAGQTTDPIAVRILTMHKAKGLNSTTCSCITEQENTGSAT